MVYGVWYMVYKHKDATTMISGTVSPYIGFWTKDLRSKKGPTGNYFTPQKSVQSLRLGCLLKVLRHCFTYFWGLGTAFYCHAQSKVVDQHASSYDYSS